MHHADRRQHHAVQPGARRIAVVALIVMLVTGADLFLKRWAFIHVAGQPLTLGRWKANSREVIPPHSPRTVIPSILSLKLTLNPGAVFGLGKGGRYVFIAISVLVAAAIVVAVLRTGRASLWLHLPLALILAGVLGNLYDRAVYGVVRDMLYLFPGTSLPFGIAWPGGDRELYPWIFNIADAALLCGLSIFVIRSIVHRPPAKTPTDPNH